MQTIGFPEVSVAGLEASPVAEALAGVRANEARYFSNKFKTEYVTYTPEEKPDVVAWVQKILADERGIVFAAPVLEVFVYDDDDVYWPSVYLANGVAVNVLYEKAAGGKRAVGFKLAMGAEPPAELAAFKWARQKSKIAGEIRGSFFVIKGEYL
ncbi:MAG: phage tail protein [Cellulomonadaceae bacterium]|jgi:hypothetical protein|nr:phage tail protein [Cellulomonadaceae bacterium]